VRACVYYIYINGVQIPVARSSGRLNILHWRLIAFLLAFSMEHDSFHLSGAWNFEVAATFLYSMCTLGARGSVLG